MYKGKRALLNRLDNIETALEKITTVIQNPLPMIYLYCNEIMPTESIELLGNIAYIRTNTLALRIHINDNKLYLSGHTLQDAHEPTCEVCRYENVEFDSIQKIMSEIELPSVELIEIQSKDFIIY